MSEINAVTKDVEARKNEIREQGISFFLAPATSYQRTLIEADIVKMVEDNLDLLINCADSNKSSVDIDELFS